MSSRFIPGNEVTLLVSGDRTFEQVLSAVEASRDRVWLEMFIFDPDEAGFAVLEALAAAAERGVDVVLIVDRIGSRRLRDRHLEPLRRAGGTAVWFNPLLGLQRHSGKVTFFGLHRDHRKIFVVDDVVAFCGGINISLDYGGDGEYSFYDVMLGLQGPAVGALAELFLETLADTSPYRRDLFTAPQPAGDVDVRVLPLDLRERVGELDQELLVLLSEARRAIHFTTPYFLPPRAVREALGAAAERGVEVRVLTAGRSDVPAVTVAARHQYARLLARGVRIFEMVSHPLHAKFCVADHARSIVGSYNVDRWGRHFNQEVALDVLSLDLGTRLSYCFAQAAEVEITRASITRWSALRRAAQASFFGISKMLPPPRRRRSLQGLETDRPLPAP